MTVEMKLQQSCFDFFLNFFCLKENLYIIKKEMSSTIIEILVPKNYKYTKSNMYNTFIKEIINLSGEEILPHTEFTINYKEKYCYFYDFEVDYQNDKKIYMHYHLILKPQPKIKPPLFNIFVFTKIE